MREPYELVDNILLSNTYIWSCTNNNIYVVCKLDIVYMPSSKLYGKAYGYLVSVSMLHSIYYCNALNCGEGPCIKKLWTQNDSLDVGLGLGLLYTMTNIQYTSSLLWHQV